MVHADPTCVPQLMTGEQASAAQIGGSGAGGVAAIGGLRVALAHG
jgi:hypothetical protein